MRTVTGICRCGRHVALFRDLVVKCASKEVLTEPMEISCDLVATLATILKGSEEPYGDL